MSEPILDCSPPGLLASSIVDDTGNTRFLAYIALQLAYFVSAFTQDFQILRHFASRNLYLWTLVGLGLRAVSELAGIAAAGELAGSSVLSALGRSKSGYIAADLVRMSAFHVCALAWLIYVLLPEQRRFDLTPALSVTDLENRAEELQRIIEQ